MELLCRDVTISVDVNLAKRLHQIAHGCPLLPLHHKAELLVRHGATTLGPVAIHCLV